MCVERRGLLYLIAIVLGAAFAPELTFGRSG
jgi:hypothetical protein